MKASAHAPMRPDCPAPPLAILSLISVAPEYPPLYVAAGSSPLTPTKAVGAKRSQDRKGVRMKRIMSVGWKCQGGVLVAIS